MSTRLTRAFGRMPSHINHAWTNLRLVPTHHDQIRRFLNLRKRFESQYAVNRDSGLGRFTVPHWDEFNRRFEEFLLPRPPMHFLKHAQLRSQMFVDERYLEDEMPLLRSMFDPMTLDRLLAEDSVGAPYLLSLPSLRPTSTNRVHTLYHLARLIEATSPGVLSEVGSVAEWGGGYGCMARVFSRLIDRDVTYFLIDTPLLSSLQWLYLSSILGEEKVNLISDRDATKRPGRINIVPVHMVESLDLHCDLFLSTWALDESSIEAQELVVANEWFGARHLLLSTAETPPSKGSDHSGMNDEYLVVQAQKIGAREHEIPFMPWSRYSFL